MARTLMALALALGCAACFDFIAPEFPEAGAPALILVAAFVEPQELRVEATVAPRLDRFGFERPVPDDTVRVNGLPLVPDDTAAAGVRTYSGIWAPAPASIANGIEIIAPAVEGIEAEPPRFRWVPAQRVGSDTLTITAGEPIVLHLDPTPAEPVPAPTLRQWFLTLQSASTTLRISADAPPPATLTIPREFVPTDSGTVSILLSDRQSTTLRPPPGDYVGIVSLDARLRWTVLVRPDTAS
jgi:hypothetical protein